MFMMSSGKALGSGGWRERRTEKVSSVKGAGTSSVSAFAAFRSSPLATSFSKRRLMRVGRQGAAGGGRSSLGGVPRGGGGEMSVRERARHIAAAHRVAKAPSVMRRSCRARLRCWRVPPLAPALRFVPSPSVANKAMPITPHSSAVASGLDTTRRRSLEKAVRANGRRLRGIHCTALAQPGARSRGRPNGSRERKMRSRVQDFDLGRSSDG